jgi:hypothetical protein
MKKSTALQILNSFLLTDPDKPLLMKIIQLISHFSWELPQQLLGVLLALIYLSGRGINNNIFHYKGAIFLESPYYGKGAGLTLGNIITTGPGTGNAMKQHEFGHYIQSRILGPLYLPFIALPSLLWAITLTRGWRRGYFSRVNYDDFIIESNATSLGKKFAAGIS